MFQQYKLWIIFSNPFETLRFSLPCLVWYPCYIHCLAFTLINSTGTIINLLYLSRYLSAAGRLPLSKGIYWITFVTAGPLATSQYSVTWCSGDLPAHSIGPTSCHKYSCLWCLEYVVILWRYMCKHQMMCSFTIIIKANTKIRSLHLLRKR